jgi:excisionase family DNA binding protein
LSDTNIKAATRLGHARFGAGRLTELHRFTDPAEAVSAVTPVEEAADQLGVGRTLMYALVSSGAVESVRIGRLRRVPTDALVAFLDALRDCQRGGAA